MSFVRVLLSAVVVGLSTFALSANAADANNNANNDNQQASAQAQASSQSPAQAQHKATAHHRAMAKIDLNAADAATLAKVKGIGLKKAEAIVAYRSKNGPFKSLADLRDVTNAKGKALFNNKQIARLESRVIING